jgi:hypothetical protein
MDASSCGCTAVLQERLLEAAGEGTWAQQQQLAGQLWSRHSIFGMHTCEQSGVYFSNTFSSIALLVLLSELGHVQESEHTLLSRILCEACCQPLLLLVDGECVVPARKTKCHALTLSLLLLLLLYFPDNFDLLPDVGRACKTERRLFCCCCCCIFQTTLTCCLTWGVPASTKRHTVTYSIFFCCCCCISRQL